VSQENRPQFPISRATRHTFGADIASRLIGVVRADLLQKGTKTLMSGAEIYGPDIRKSIVPGAHIVVEAAPSAHGEKDWSVEEVGAVVADYFVMLKNQLERKGLQQECPP
jgi:hypothetical protein